MDVKNSTAPLTKQSSEFNAFAQAVWAEPLIKQALRCLHDMHRLNSSLLLYCAWFAKAKLGRLQKNRLLQLLESIAPWHQQILELLQQCYQKCQDGVHAKRLDIMALLREEMDAASEIERFLLAETLLRLQPATRSASQQLADACYNIVAYCKYAEVQLASSELEAVLLMLQFVFPALAMPEIHSAMEHAMNTAKWSQAGYTQPQLV